MSEETIAKRAGEGAVDDGEMGERMRLAAAQAGISGYAIAKRLGVKPSTIYQWWSGRHGVRRDKLIRYAEIVGKPMAYFFAEAETEQPRELGELLLAWADRLMAGETPVAAFDRVTGEPAELTPRGRRKLTTAGDRMRNDLESAAGKDWERLTEEERRQVLRQIRELAAPRRAG